MMQTSQISSTKSIGDQENCLTSMLRKRDSLEKLHSLLESALGKK
jgi:hypothetical protein